MIDVKDYWDRRYLNGGTSGGGSYGVTRDFKLGFLNRFFKDNYISSVVDLGCGDGSVASGLVVTSYTGIDIAPEAVRRCVATMSAPGRTFHVSDDFPYASKKGSYDLALSQDVLYHLIPEDMFEQHLSRLFHLAARFVIIFSTDREYAAAFSEHVKHRNFTKHVAEKMPQWKLMEVVNNPLKSEKIPQENPSSDFFIYRRLEESGAH